jgi:peptidoglycan/xylan/chitin deacetylase (PgdA/CDA1 family)
VPPQINIRDIMAFFWWPVCRLTSRLQKNSSAQLRILCFHHVNESQRAAFENLLNYLIRFHQVISPAEAEKFIHSNNETGDKNRIQYLITFDDGFRSQYDVALDILDKYGIKAIFFICPGIIDIAQESIQKEWIAQNLFCPPIKPESVSDGMLMMSWENAEYLHSMGHVLGAHTLFHKKVSALNGRKLHDEIVLSGKTIEQRLGTPAKWFAYPFGDPGSISREALAIIREHYTYCFSAIRGNNLKSSDPYGLLRQGADLSRSFIYQRVEVEGCLDYIHRDAALKFKEMVKKNN